jgi:hypothetical protein
MVCESMDLDDEFIEKAKEIRKNMQNMNSNNIVYDEISIGSKYNSEKLIGKCEICNNENASDVHHINQQCDANHNNLIENNDYGIFNKNKLWNLVALCKKCHQSVHSSPPKLEISGYVNTSVGLELIFKRIGDDGGSDVGDGDDNHDNVNTIIMPPITPAIPLESASAITPLIRQIIIDMKNTNNTPKKIQYDLKRYHKIDMTQQKIRDFI